MCDEKSNGSVLPSVWSLQILFLGDYLGVNAQLVSNTAQSDSPVLNISDVFLSLDIVIWETFGDQLFRANHTWKAALWNVCSSLKALIHAPPSGGTQSSSSVQMPLLLSPKLLWVVHCLLCLCSDRIVCRKVIAVNAAELQRSYFKKLLRSYHLLSPSAVNQVLSSSVPTGLWWYLLSSICSTHSPPSPCS